MTDIDFDELDRAVNGALGGNDTSTPASPSEEAPVASETPTVVPIERTTLSPTSSNPSSAAAGTPPLSTAPAARRSSGRFMDMVHPSSDMRSQARGAAVDNKPQPQPSVAQPEAEPSAPEYTETPAWNEPLESPFLADAKVEKRPLGGVGVAAPETVTIVDSFDFQGLLDEPEEDLLEAPEAQERIEAIATPDPIDFAAAVPAEVESKTYEAEALVSIEEAPIEPEAVIIEEPQATTGSVQLAEEEPVGPTSITPQYKEQPSSNQESGAMYDTESYHQAVAAPVKKKSGWFTVLWILLLVVFGAGAGWAVYTYVLPML